MNLRLNSWNGIITHNGTTAQAITLLNDLVESESGVIELADGSLHDAYEGGQAPRKARPFSVEFMLVYPTPAESEAYFKNFNVYVGYNGTAYATSEAGTSYSCQARLVSAKLKPLFHKGQVTNNKLVKLDLVPFGEFLPA